MYITFSFLHLELMPSSYWIIPSTTLVTRYVNSTLNILNMVQDYLWDDENYAITYWLHNFLISKTVLNLLSSRLNNYIGRNILNINLQKYWNAKLIKIEHQAWISEERRRLCNCSRFHSLLTPKTFLNLLFFQKHCERFKLYVERKC